MGGEASRVTQFLSDDELAEIISVFPAVEFAFAYGSGVVQQKASGLCEVDGLVLWRRAVLAGGEEWRRQQ